MKIKNFRNKELVNVTKKIVIVTVLAIVALIMSTSINIDILNKRVVDINSAIVGSILSNNPELEKDIIENLTRDIKKENIELGENILKKYGYSIDMDILSNKGLKDIYVGFIFQYSIIIIIFILLSYYIFYRNMEKIYEEITGVSKVARRVVEGDFSRLKINYNEGDIPIFKESFNLMIESLEKNISLLKKEKEFLNDLISDITHQLKTPLSSLIIFNELMESNNIDDVEILNDCIKSSREQLDRMEWLVQSLLKLARLESGSIMFSKEEVEINDTLDLAIKPFKAVLHNKDRIELIGDINCKINHDKQWTAEALSNLIKNAIEHSESNKKIKVICDEGPIYLKIKVIDEGIGIESNEKQKIFTRFYRGKNNKNTNSIGIGLSLTKSIIEGQGGEIKVYSEKGIGTTFSIIMYKKSQGVI